ncbi:PREDICTED: AT-hook motif nuclear-localized protein 7-like [Erythranthe guttata]|uniref:AT-hook motif nuclear-localized protein 7-like n=1 Tax=Erythranthe guttata TaxID=4155 RepID=UPI00064DB1B8|nr:PREDICTED: AT-hook motif nuclear-localized protein 7-like [Erythranthe guttata]|eukprot:XP_012834160.1 PREDICTED: AT-hook motif nuclear-localized protein 7-like [Erythranthe guttata]
MEDLCVDNTIPHHATSVAAAEHSKVVEVAVEEETLEKAGGDKTDLKIENLCVENTIPHHATFDAIAEYEEMVEVAPNEEMAESVGGDNTGEIVGETVERNFTFHTITIEQGEDIVQRIRSFSEMTPDSICIISASGTVSIAEVYVPNPCRDIFRYEGELTIIHLNRSHTYDGIRGAKKCLLSVLLADSEGRCYGGAVAGSLIAAGPTRVIIGTFIQILRHRKRRTAAPENQPLAAPFSRSADN